MKPLKTLDHLRHVRAEIDLYGGIGDDHGGVFLVDGKLLVIASSGLGWDHVSVTALVGHCCPTWEDMERVRRAFFEANETVVQIHAPESKYVDGSAFGSAARRCLHLWRKQGFNYPLPPSRLLGTSAADFEGVKR